MPSVHLYRTGTARERDHGLLCVRLRGSDGNARPIAFIYICLVFFWHPRFFETRCAPLPSITGFEPVKLTVRFACYAGRFIAGAGISWAGV